MKKFLTISIILGALAPSIVLNAQKNRISLQSGTVHCFFDNTPLINFEKTSNVTGNILFPLSFFGGYLNDSWSIQYRRLLDSKSNFSFEFSNLRTSYQPLYTNMVGGPFIIWKRLYKINLSYSRNLKLNNKWQFNYGAGINTQWGIESWFLTYTTGFWEPHFQNNYRNDIGLNVRSGFEYSPIPNLTFFSQMDFLGVLFLSYPSDGNEYLFPNFYLEHGNKIKASKFDLSLNFGIGFNF